MKFPIKKFISYYKPYLTLLIADFICALIAAGITLLLPLCIRYITKNILEDGMANALNEIYRVGLIMLVLVLVHTFCNLFLGYQGHVIGARMESAMRSELFEKYQKLTFRFYDEHKTGELMSRISNDLLSLTELYHHGPEDIIVYSVKFIGAFVILVHINIKLTLIIFALLPIVAIYILIQNKELKLAYRESKERIADINTQAEDTLAGIRVVKSFANESVEQKKFNIQNHRFLQSRKRVYKDETVLFDGAEAIIQLIHMAVVVLGGIFILKGSLDLADLLTFLLYINFFMEPIQKLVHITQQYQEGFASFHRFMEIIDLEPEIQEIPNAKQLTNVKGEITFEEVGFRYQDDHENVLNQISFQAQPGEYLALVGSSGVGKTTLCSLIPRFYDIKEGRILIDGTDIREFSLKSLREHIGVVQQDVYLFAGTIFENISYGKPNATREEVIQAAKQANAHDFIMGFPKGYDTDIGQRGIKLSGGQKQRLSIARVFLKNPPILIFDEATSALDNESERAIQNSLEILSQNRTTLVIAHRLSTIRNAKRILVLTCDGISEQGTHEELLQQNGIYADLYQMQF